MGTHGNTPKVSDDDAPFGAVRQIRPQGRPEVVVYVENAGDFMIPLSVIKAVHSQKFVVDGDKLEHRLRKAIGHANDDDGWAVADLADLDKGATRSVGTEYAEPTQAIDLGRQQTGEHLVTSRIHDHGPAQTSFPLEMLGHRGRAALDGWLIFRAPLQAATPAIAPSDSRVLGGSPAFLVAVTECQPPFRSRNDRTAAVISSSDTNRRSARSSFRSSIGISMCAAERPTGAVTRHCSPSVDRSPPATFHTA